VNFNQLAYPAVILVALTGLILLANRDWRLGVTSLGVQYVGVFVLVAISWSLEMAAVKLIAGWMSAAVLGMALVGGSASWREEEVYWPMGFLFRILASGLVGLAVLSFHPSVRGWLPQIQPQQSLGGLILIGMGLLQLGLTSRPLGMISGLLTAISGFEILYAVVENSVLVAGLLAVINLGLALMGAYLLVAPAIKVDD
jgi:hypothetical protein